jgi:hypothetical protein
MFFAKLNDDVKTSSVQLLDQCLVNAVGSIGHAACTGTDDDAPAYLGGLILVTNTGG